jgi:putative flippase GtrA
VGREQEEDRHVVLLRGDEGTEGDRIPLAQLLDRHALHFSQPLPQLFDAERFAARKVRLLERACVLVVLRLRFLVRRPFARRAVRLLARCQVGGNETRELVPEVFFRRSLGHDGVLGQSRATFETLVGECSSTGTNRRPRFVRAARARYASKTERESEPVLIRALVMRLVRSGGAGILATVADVGTLTLLVSVFGVEPVRASVPSLVFGSIVMFLGHKYFVFEQRSVSTLGRETVLFTVVQVVGIVISTWVYKVLLGLAPIFQSHYVLVRLAANNLVWLGYFFPLWHYVFKSTPPGPKAVSVEADGAGGVPHPGLNPSAAPADTSAPTAAAGPPFVG